MKNNQLQISPNNLQENQGKIDSEIMWIDNQFQKYSAKNYLNKASINQLQSKQTFKLDWSQRDQLKLYQLHDELGNKWAVISGHFPNRTDNGVKNYFYAKLRKGLRKLNKIIYQFFKKELTEIKVIVLYKIIEATEEKHKKTYFCDVEVSDLCTELKNRILSYSCDKSEFNNYQKHPKVALDLIHDLIGFSKQYKRKAKKYRKNSGQELTSQSASKINSRKNSDSQYGQSQMGQKILPSDISILNSSPSSLQSIDSLQIEDVVKIRKRTKSNQEISMDNQYHLNEQDQVLSEKMQEQSIEITLQHSGIFENEYLPPLFDILKKTSYLSYNMDGFQQNDQFQYFEQSAFQASFLPLRSYEDQFKANIFQF